VRGRLRALVSLRERLHGRRLKARPRARPGRPRRACRRGVVGARAPARPCVLEGAAARAAALCPRKAQPPQPLCTSPGRGSSLACMPPAGVQRPRAARSGYTAGPGGPRAHLAARAPAQPAQAVQRAAGVRALCLQHALSASPFSLWLRCRAGLRASQGACLTRGVLRTSFTRCCVRSRQAPDMSAFASGAAGGRCRAAAAHGARP